MAGNAQIIVEFVADMAKLATGAKDVEKAGASASKSLDWKGIAKWTAAAGGLAAAGGFIAKAASSTSDLAKETAKLQRITGFDTKTASEWVLLLQQRGIATDTFGRAIARVSSLMDSWMKKGSKGNPLKDLGVSLEAIRSGDVGAVFQEIVDAIGKLPTPAQKSAAATKVFGKAGLALLPILSKGTGELNKTLDATNKYGAALSGSTLKAVQDQTKAQRELKAMHQGVATTIGAAVLPVQAELFGVLVDSLGVLTPLLQNQKLMTVAVTAGAAAYVAYKAAVIASSVAGSKDLIVTIAKTTWKGAEAVATWAVTAAQWAFNAAMIAGLGPILVVVAAVAALIAVGILVWKNWDTISAGLSRAFAAIKAAALAVWNWIKSNWPLLLAILTGPFGLAVLAIQRNWSTIRAAVTSGVNAVRSAFQTLSSWVSSIVGAITRSLSSLASAFAKPGQAAKDAAAAVKEWIGKIPGYIEAVVGKVSSAANSVANAIKRPINAVLSAFNGLRFTIPSIPIPKISLPGGGSVGGGSVGGSTIGGFHVPLLARGGVLDRPTLFVGGERGREIVTPEALLREILDDHGGDSFTLNVYPRTADAQDVAYGFRRLELLRTGR